MKIGEQAIDVKIEKGVRQGETMSPKLFSACIEWIFRRLNWDEKGLMVDGRRLNHLRFADDIILISHRKVEVQDMLQELADVSLQVGLEINRKKTMVMTNRRRTPVVLNGEQVDYCDSYIYLGQRLSFDQSMSREIQRRIQAGWYGFIRYEEFFMKKTVPMHLKRKLFHSNVIPAMLYGAETWTMTGKDYKKLAVAQRKMERRMVGTSLLDRRRNEWLRGVTKVDDVRTVAVERKWKWARRIASMDNNRWAKVITEWRPRKHRRDVGRPKRRWRDDFRDVLGEPWKRQAEDQAVWNLLMEQHVVTILNLQ